MDEMLDQAHNRARRLGALETLVLNIMVLKGRCPRTKHKSTSKYARVTNAHPDCASV